MALEATSNGNTPHQVCVSARELWCARILFDIQHIPFFTSINRQDYHSHCSNQTLYEAALLTVDSIILEAISNGNTPSGLRARELCSQAAKAQLIKDGEATADGQTTAGGLSGCTCKGDWICYLFLPQMSSSGPYLTYPLWFL